MLRHRLGVVVAAVLVAATGACGSDNPTPGGQSPPTSHGPSTVKVSETLARQLGDAHAATAKYANNLAAAQRDGYMIITGMMPGMGFHYLNPKIQGFDPAKPPILVYAKQGSAARLVALEWVWPEQPATPPFEGATYGSFDAACHFKDGTFEVAAAEKDCGTKGKETGSPFNFWHPKLVTLHVWLWYTNPAGMYNGTNPLVEPYNT
jgi:hypothetical protein